MSHLTRRFANPSGSNTPANSCPVSEVPVSEVIDSLLGSGSVWSERLKFPKTRLSRHFVSYGRSPALAAASCGLIHSHPRQFVHCRLLITCAVLPLHTE